MSVSESMAAQTYGAGSIQWMPQIRRELKAYNFTAQQFKRDGTARRKSAETVDPRCLGVPFSTASTKCTVPDIHPARK